MKSCLLYLGIAGFILASASLAQADKDDAEPGNLVRQGLVGRTITNAPSVLPTNIPFNKVTKPGTDAIVGQISSSTGLCKRIAKEYMVDCISDRLARIAAGLPKTGEYREARMALEQASIKLHMLAQANAETSLPKIRIQSKSDGSGVRPRALTPIKPESFDTVKVEAAEIIAEAETVLLRSAENSAKRKVHFERIAKAVGSNKVILRSL